MIAQTDPPYLHGFAALFEREGYHLRKNGEKCPRGHAGPFRDNRSDCAECRKLFEKSWRVTRTAAHSALDSGTVPFYVERLLGVCGSEFRAFLLEACRHNGFKPDDYGVTWGLYRIRQLRTFDLESPEDFSAANSLANLQVARLHNQKAKRSNNPAQLKLFPNL